MVIVCAWCRRFLGVKREDVVVSHGMCDTCMSRNRWRDAPTLVVSRSHEEIMPILRDLLQGTPEIHVVVDRRQGERRNGHPDPGHASERREGDRRRGVAIALV
jgi:hypothetical protein